MFGVVNIRPGRAMHPVHDARRVPCARCIARRNEALDNRLGVWHIAITVAMDAANRAGWPNDRSIAVMNTTANTVNIGGDEVDIATLPQSSIIALLQRGINHVLGNEVASKVSTAKKAVKGGDGADKDELKYTESELSELHDKTFAEKVSAITNGTLGVRGPGVAKVTPLERLVRDIAVGVLRRQATAKGLKWPHGKGSGDAVSAMVDAYLAVAKYRTAAEALAQTQLDAMASLATTE